MTRLRTALLGAAAMALPLAAFAGSATAAEPASARAAPAAPPVVMIVLPGWGMPMPAAFATPFQPPGFFPSARLIAAENALFRQQNAMFQHMMQDANQMLHASWTAMPNGLVQAALRNGPGQTTQMVMTSFSSGGDTCRETVTTLYPGHGAAPHMVVHKTGNDCSALHIANGGATQVALPAPQETAPQPAPVEQGTKLLRVGYQPQSHAPVHSAVWWRRD